MTPGERATAAEVIGQYPGVDPGAAMARIEPYAAEVWSRWRAGAYGSASSRGIAYGAAHTVCTNIINNRPEES